MNLKSICDGYDKIKTFKENDNENYSKIYAQLQQKYSLSWLSLNKQVLLTFSSLQ